MELFQSPGQGSTWKAIGSITPRNERQGAVAELCTFLLIEALLLIGYNTLVKGDSVWLFSALEGLLFQSKQEPCAHTMQGQRTD